MGNQPTRPTKPNLICISQNSSHKNASREPFYYAEKISNQGSDMFAFRQVLYTSPNLMQWVRMQLLPNQEIGSEIHVDTDQFFFVESGRGTAVLRDQPYTEELPLAPGSVIIVSAGTRHNIVNQSSIKPLVLYTMYTPAEHDRNTLQIEKPL